MPVPGELVTRRGLLKYIGVAAAGAAVPTAFFLGRSSAPAPVTEIPKPSPETTKPPEPTSIVAVPQPKPTPRPTAFIPELATPTRLPPAASRPTEKPRAKELPRGKVWEIPLKEYTHPDRAFTVVQNRIFAVNAGGTPVEFNLTTDKPEWGWERRGIIFGKGKSLIFFLNLEALRAHAIDADTKQEKWRYLLPGMLFNNSPPGENTAAAAGLHSWTDSEHIAFESGWGIAIVAPDGQAKVVPRGKILFFTDNKIIYLDQGTMRVEKPFGDDPGAWQDNELYKPIIDQDLVIYTKFNRQQGATMTKIQARETKNGNVVWTKDVILGAQPSFLSRDILVLEDPDWGRQTPFYYLHSTKDWTEIHKFGKDRLIPYKFFSKDNWTFVTHPRGGTNAFLDGKGVWQNEDIFSPTHCLGEIEGRLILARGESAVSSSDPEGTVWSVDTKTGRKALWGPVYFDRMMTTPLRLGDKLVVSHGVGGKRYNLDILDLKTGQKTNVLSPNLPIERLLYSGTENIILGHYASKLVALRV